MRSSIHLDYAPIDHSVWWKANVTYSKFERQPGMSITCASFHHPNPKASIILVTGWSECFLKYSSIIKSIFEDGFSVYTYDHQCQGLSSRWLNECQSTWVHTFEDYVDDLVYFVRTVPKGSDEVSIPVYLLAHSMGGLISTVAMSRDPNLVSRAILSAPMLRNKCGMKCFDYKYPFPQPVAYWLTNIASMIGLGTMNTIGSFKEEPYRQLRIKVTTSEQSQLNKWYALRIKYPQIMSTCVTNDWLIHAINLQKRCERRYAFVKTNTLILSAERDCFVYNRAMAMFAAAAPSCKLMKIPDSYHEILFENDAIRHTAMKVILDYYNQVTDDVSHVTAIDPLVECDIALPIYTKYENFTRVAGVLMAITGVVLGVSLIVNGSSFATMFADSLRNVKARRA